jgi:hypothetical protein
LVGSGGLWRPGAEIAFAVVACTRLLPTIE